MSNFLNKTFIFNKSANIKAWLLEFHHAIVETGDPQSAI